MRLPTTLLIFALFLSAIASAEVFAQDDSGPKEFYKVLPRQGTRARKPARQNPPPEPKAGSQPIDDAKIDTTIHVELLVGTEGAGLNAQQWEQDFSKLGIALRIRSGLPSDKVEIREKTIGRLRTINIVGRLEKNGDLTFSGRAFKQGSSGALGEWIRELKTYGAQGSPEGKPLWGLNKDQFQELYMSLAPVVDVELKDVPIDTALERLALPAKYPLAQMLSARERLKRTGFSPTVNVDVKGFSKGTAFAIVLQSLGLGFRPQRTPDASIELSVESLNKTTDVWPIGWSPPAGTPPRTIAPTLYELVTVQFDSRPLRTALAEISAQTGMPVAIDEPKIRAKGIKLEELIVKHPEKQTSYDLVLKRVTSPRLIYRLRIDEAQRPFIWITPIEAGPPAR